MSQNEFHFGKLRKVNLKDKSIEDFFKEKCIKVGMWEDADVRFENTWQNIYCQEHSSDEYFVHKDEVYEVFQHESMDDEYLQKLIPNEDGTFTFMMGFYNGGTYLGEMIQESLNEL